MKQYNLQITVETSKIDKMEKIWDKFVDMISKEEICLDWLKEKEI